MDKNLVSSNLSTFKQYAYYYGDNEDFNTNFVNEYTKSYMMIKKEIEKESFKQSFDAIKQRDMKILSLLGLNNLDATAPETQLKLNLTIYKNLFSKSEIKEENKKTAIIYIFNRYIHDKNIISPIAKLQKNNETVFSLFQGFVSNSQLINFTYDKSTQTYFNLKGNIINESDIETSVGNFWMRYFGKKFNENNSIDKFIKSLNHKDDGKIVILYTEKFFESFALQIYNYFSTQYKSYLEKYNAKNPLIKDIIKDYKEKNEQSAIGKIFKTFFELNKDLIIKSFSDFLKQHAKELNDIVKIRGAFGESLAQIFLQFFSGNKWDVEVTGAEKYMGKSVPTDVLVTTDKGEKIRIQAKEYKISTLQEGIKSKDENKPTFFLDQTQINFTGATLYYYFPNTLLEDIKFLIGNLHMAVFLKSLDSNSVIDIFEKEIPEDFYSQALVRVNTFMERQLSGNELFFISGTFVTASWFLQVVINLIKKSVDTITFERVILDNSGNNKIKKRYDEGKFDQQKIQSSSSIKSNLFMKFKGVTFQDSDFILWPDNYKNYNLQNFK